MGYPTLPYLRWQGPYNLLVPQSNLELDYWG
jgi:hypothetical protein